jgi:hypothetical protein
MDGILKDSLRALISKHGKINIDHTVEKKLIKDLIEKLWPLETGLDLIRIGPKGDGGYLLPEDLEGIEACFSPGVDIISEFELECYKRGMQIYLADKSVDNPRLNIPKEEYSFLKKFIGVVNNDDFITMDTWVDSSKIKPNSDLLLQMDIEGHEYTSIISMSDKLLKRFRIVVIEFHDLHKLWNESFYKLASSSFEKILQTHLCVHIHPNNIAGIYKQNGISIPRVAEFTFIRKDRVSEIDYVKTFPHKLDFDNVIHMNSIKLPQDWYKK